jgi:hypothetical protein
MRSKPNIQHRPTGGPASRRGRRPRGPRSRGQSLVELALVLPVLLLLLLMGLDFGRVFLGWVNLNNAARVAANYASQHPNAWTVPTDAVVLAEYQRLIAADAAATNCTLPNPVPAPTFPSGTGLGQPAVVSIRCTFSVITPVISGILGNGVAVSAQAAFPIRFGAILGMPLQTAVPTPTAAPTPTPTPAPTPTPTPGPTPTGGPTPSPSPTPTPTPTPTPRVNCTVPDFKNDDSSTAQATWAAAGFQTTVVFSPQVPPHYTMKTQSLTKNSTQLCATATVTVGP